MVKLTILHNETKDFLEDLSGFSIFIEAYSKRILFDTSMKGQLIENASKAKIDLSDIDYVVLSHGHPDHTDGLKDLDFSGVKNLVAHPNCFEKKWDYVYGSFCGCSTSLEELQTKTNVITSRKPFWILENKIVFLGEVPRLNDFESKRPEDRTEKNEKDNVSDDSALAIKTDKGVVLISGCSHSGICNIIEYAEKVTGDKIHAVLGGFHLFDEDVIEKTVMYFKKRQFPEVYPSHCLSKQAFKEFEKIGGKRINTLQILEF